MPIEFLCIRSLIASRLFLLDTKQMIHDKAHRNSIKYLFCKISKIPFPVAEVFCSVASNWIPPYMFFQRLRKYLLTK